MQFPKSWLELLETHSDLCGQAGVLLKQIEIAVEDIQNDGKIVLPPELIRYRAFELVSPLSTKVILVGQDPYHGMVQLPDRSSIPQATGLSFSVPATCALPPSLRNIFKELAADIGAPPPVNGDLTHWAEQGVLLLNTILTVEKGSPKSHRNLGWQKLTGGVIQALSRARQGLVFILWGNEAQLFREHIVCSSHTIISSSHPSPIGGACFKSFLGSRPFSRANAALISYGYQSIHWAP